MTTESLLGGARSARTRFWVRLWFWTRERAIQRLRADHFTEYEEARLTWSKQARFDGILGDPHAWNTRALAGDLALHDAADNLLGKHA